MITYFLSYFYRMTYKVIFAYPVDNPPKELPKFTKGPLVIEQTVPYEKIDRIHMIGVKRALLYIAPSAYNFISKIDKEFAEFFRNKGRLMKKIMFRTKIKPEEIDMSKYIDCVYIVQDNPNELDGTYYPDPIFD